MADREDTPVKSVQTPDADAVVDRILVDS